MSNWFTRIAIFLGALTGAIALPILRATFFIYIFSRHSNLYYLRQNGPYNLILLCLPSVIWGGILGGAVGSIYAALRREEPEEARATCHQVGAICFWFQTVFIVFLGVVTATNYNSAGKFGFAALNYLAGNTPLQAAALMYGIALLWRGRPVQVSNTLRV